MTRTVKVAVLLALLAVPALLATIIVPEELTCAICGTKNKVFVMRSAGSLACGAREGDFDVVPCPIEYAYRMWSCTKCGYASYQHDASVPPQKVDPIRRFLAEARKSIPASPRTTDRFDVAEGIYRILGRDDRFWSEFYRVAAFFAAEDGRGARARELRTKALAVTEKLLADPRHAATHKEHLLVAGAMAARLGHTALARKYLRGVREARYDPPQSDRAAIAAKRKEMHALAARILESLR